MQCQMCTTDKPPQAFKWFENASDEEQARMEGSYVIECCEECHEREYESKFLTSCIHDVWLEKWGPYVSRPPEPEEVREDLELVFSKNFKNEYSNTPWIVAYKQQVMTWATEEYCPNRVSEIEELLSSFRVSQNQRAIGYVHSFLNMAVRLEYYMN